MASRNQYKEGISLASGLMARDRHLLMGLYLILIAPAVISSLLPAMSTETAIILSVMERFLHANFFYILLRRWFGFFSTPEYTPSITSYLIIMGVHLFFWCIVTLPVLAPDIGIPEAFDLIVIVLLVPISAIALRYFFYFVPVMLGRSNARSIIRESDHFTTFHRALPLKILLPPLVVSTLYTGLITGFSPDVRHTAAALLIDAGDGIFWVLSCYLSLGVGFSILAKNRPLTSYLDPYLDARLATLRLNAPAWLTGLLHPGHAGKFILLSALIWSGNMVRMWELEPAPSIELKEITYDGKGEVAMKLRLSDAQHFFRGFRPILFRLAGESGDALTASPSEAVTVDGSKGVLYYFPRSRAESELWLKFSLLERADDFNKLIDIYLWYAHKKVAYIDQSKVFAKPSTEARGAVR